MGKGPACFPRYSSIGSMAACNASFNFIFVVGYTAGGNGILLFLGIGLMCGIALKLHV